MSKKALLTALLSSFLLLFASAVLAEEKGDGKGEGKDEGEGFNPKEGDEAKLKSGDRDRELLNKINAAVEKGCNYLKSRQEPDGSWQCVWFAYAEPHKYMWGETALSLLALLKSGENRNSDCIEKGFKFLRQQPLNKVYQVSVLILALEARWAKQDVKARQEEITQAAPPTPLPANDKTWMEECVRYLLENREMSWRIYGMDKENAGQTPDTWHYPGPQGTSTEHSNTQLALLALKAARRCQIPIPMDVWENCLKHFVETQELSGPEVQRVQVIEDKKHGYRVYKPLTSIPDRARGWCYSAAANAQTGSADSMTASTGSMTTVGISSIAIAISELPRDFSLALRKKAETAMLDGLAWLDLNWKIDCNPNHPEKRWHYYYLYGVERAAVLTNSRALGKHDWYREGAEFLLKAQGGDGKWDDTCCPGPINNTCFALLFLTKATVPVGAVITGRH